MVSIHDDPSKEYKKLITKFKESKSENSKFLIYDLLNLKVAETIGRIELKKFIKEISFHTASRGISQNILETIIGDFYKENKADECNKLLHWINNCFLFLIQNEQKSKREYGKNKKSQRTINLTIKEYSYQAYRDFNIKILILDNLNFFYLNRVKEIEHSPVINIKNQNLLIPAVVKRSAGDSKIESMTLILFFIFYSTNSLEQKAEAFWELIDFRKQGFVQSSDKYFFALLKKLLYFILFFPDVMLNDLLYMTDGTILDKIEMTLRNKDKYNLPDNSMEFILYTYNSHMNTYKTNLFYAKSVKHTMQDFTSYFSHNFFFVEKVTNPKLTKSKYLELLKEQDYLLFDTGYIRDYFHHYIEEHSERVNIFSKEIKKIFLFYDNVNPFTNNEQAGLTGILEKKYIFSNVINELGLRDDCDKFLTMIKEGNYFSFMEKFRNQETRVKKKRRTTIKQSSFLLHSNKMLSSYSKKDNLNSPGYSRKNSFSSKNFESDVSNIMLSNPEVHTNVSNNRDSTSLDNKLTNYLYLRRSSSKKFEISKSQAKNSSPILTESVYISPKLSFSEKNFKEIIIDTSIAKIIEEKSKVSHCSSYFSEEEKEIIGNDNGYNIIPNDYVDTSLTKPKDIEESMKSVNEINNEKADTEYKDVITLGITSEPDYEADGDKLVNNRLSSSKNFDLELDHFIENHINKSNRLNAHSEKTQKFTKDIDDSYNQESKEIMCGDNNPENLSILIAPDRPMSLNLDLSPYNLQDENSKLNLQENIEINKSHTSLTQNEPDKIFEYHSGSVENNNENSLEKNALNDKDSSGISLQKTNKTNNDYENKIILKLRSESLSVQESDVNIAKSELLTIEIKKSKAKFESDLDLQTINKEELAIFLTSENRNIEHISNYIVQKTNNIVSEDCTILKGNKESLDHFLIETKRISYFDIQNQTDSFLHNNGFTKDNELDESDRVITSLFLKIENEIENLKYTDFNVADIINHSESYLNSKLNHNIEAILVLDAQFNQDMFMHLPNPIEILEILDSHVNFKVFNLYMWMMTKCINKESEVALVDLQFFKNLQNDYHNNQKIFKITIQAYKEMLFDKDNLFISNKKQCQYLIVPIVLENFSESNTETMIIAQFDFGKNTIIFYDTPDVLYSNISISK